MLNLLREKKTSIQGGEQLLRRLVEKLTRRKNSRAVRELTIYLDTEILKFHWSSSDV